MSATAGPAPSEGDRDGLTGLAQSRRRFLDDSAFVVGEVLEPGLVAADVCCDHLELSVHVFDRPAGRVGGEYGLALLAKIVGVAAKLGKVEGV